MLATGHSIGTFHTISDLGSATNNINNILKGCGTAIGGILIAFAALKIVAAMADENVVERQRAALLFGTGIIFVSMSAVVDFLIGSDGITSGDTVGSVAQNIVLLIGNVGKWGAVIMVLFGTFSYILSIANESAEQQTKATSALMVGVGFMTLSTACSTIGSLVAGGSTNASSYSSAIISWLCSTAQFSGGFVLIAGVFKLILSIREEDAKSRSEAFKLLVIAAMLVIFGTIVNEMGL